MKIATALALALLAAPAAAQEIAMPADAGPQARALIEVLTDQNDRLIAELQRLQEAMESGARPDSADAARLQTVMEGFALCQEQRQALSDQVQDCQAALFEAANQPPSATIVADPVTASPPAAPAGAGDGGQTCDEVRAERLELLTVFSETHPRVVRLDTFLQAQCGQ